MSADIIPLRRKDGNGAREALTAIAKEAKITDASDWADELIFRLAAWGYKVVPLEEPTPPRPA